MARLGDHGASVAHNPGSNMRLGSGLADTRAMLERQVNLGIGTDGANCADNQNMYEAMRLASFVSKVQGPDWRRWLTTREAALAATEGSAISGDRGQRPRLGVRRPDRPARARLQGRYRNARPRPSELAAVQRPGQPVGPHRGRHRGRQGHDRRPPDRRQPSRRDRRSRQVTRPYCGHTRAASRPPTPITAVSTKPSNRSSAAIARVWPAPPTTSTATARGWSDHHTH
jgi:hypothetical protein